MRTRIETRLIQVTIAGLIAIAAFLCVNLAQRARVPGMFDGYRHRNGPPAHWDYPTQAVVTWSGVVAVELVILAALVATARGVVGRCFGVGAITGVATVLLMPMVMHSPVTFGTAWMWNLCATGWLLLMGAAAIVARWFTSSRGAASR